MDHQVVLSTLESSLTTPTIDVQVRRLGTLRVELSGAGGAPLAGVPISLRSVEFGEDVASWIASGTASASSATMRTDENGVLRVERLPRGSYAWEAGSSSGEVVVPPGAEAQVVVEFDE